jgi:dCMP deaminase
MAARTNRKRKACDGNNYTRINKGDLHMIIALWMEDFVEEVPEPYNKVGAVLVLPNDIIYAADCSRDGVHAAQRLLLQHSDKAEGSKMFMSRKPCPKCAKLLVQAQVKQLLFLPREPEYYPLGEEHLQRQQVDNLFTASAIAQEKYVLQVTNDVLDDAEVKTPVKEARTDIDDFMAELEEKYGFDSQWRKDIKRKLPWQAFNKNLNQQIQIHFANGMEWIARINVLFGCGLQYTFEEASRRQYRGNDEIAFQRVRRESDFLKKARRIIAIARFLSQRTDDPKAGVGAVIVNENMEILAFGWNGFPLKASYGNFPRAPGSAKTKDKKTPYIIHAEQNALLMRNKKDIEGSILFVSGRPPCNECTPLIAMQGVKTVVLDTDEEYDVNKIMRKKEEYKMFPEKVKRKDFVCYRTKNINSHKKVNSDKKTKTAKKLRFK